MGIYIYTFQSSFACSFIAVLNGTMCMCLKLKNVRILSVFKVIFPYHDNIACFLVWVCRSRYIDAGLQFLALNSPCLLNKYNKKKFHNRAKIILYAWQSNFYSLRILWSHPQIWRQAINSAKYECRVSLLSKKKYLDVINQWICSSFFLFFDTPEDISFVHRG